MADLSANAPLRIMGEAHTERFHCNSSSAFSIYKGQPLIIDQNVDAAYVTPFVDATVVATTDVFMGIAAEGKSVASGASETNADSMIEAYVEPTIVGFKSAVFTDADCGKTVYMSDSATLSTTASQNPQIGKLHRVLDGYAFVRLSSPQVCANAT